ncbi:MAG: glutaredoxin [Pseudomonas sp.]
MNETQNYIYQKDGCPYAAKATELLDRHGIAYRVHVFSDETEEGLFRDEHGVTTTPQIFLDGQRIGGHDDLVRHLEG